MDVYGGYMMQLITANFHVFINQGSHHPEKPHRQYPTGSCTPTAPPPSPTPPVASFLASSEGVGHREIGWKSVF